MRRARNDRKKRKKKNRGGNSLTKRKNFPRDHKRAAVQRYAYTRIPKITRYARAAFGSGVYTYEFRVGTINEGKRKYPGYYCTPVVHVTMILCTRAGRDAGEFYCYYTAAVRRVRTYRSTRTFRSKITRNYVAKTRKQCPRISLYVGVIIQVQVCIARR